MRDTRTIEVIVKLLHFYVESVSELDRHVLLDSLEELRKRIR